MSSPIDLEAWHQALADRQAVRNALQRFEQNRFTLTETDRQAAAESVRFQAEEVEARLRPLRAAAEERRQQLQDRLTALGEQQEQLQARAARGRGSAAKINNASRSLQAHVSDCAVQLNVLAKLLSAEHADDIRALGDDEIAFLSLPLDTPLWTGPAETALPRVIAGAGTFALLAAFLPWFAASSATGAVGLLTGIAGDATTTPAQVLGYAGVATPAFLIAVALSGLRYRPWLIIAAAFALCFVWSGVCYARVTATVPWWSISSMFTGMGPGAWIYGLAALVGLIAACYYAQGEGNTVQRSLRTAGWLVTLFILPGLLAASLLALRPSPPPVALAVTSIADEADVLLLNITNNTDRAVDLSLPWSNETPYGIRIEIKLSGAELFRGVEETAECWRSPVDKDRLLNRIPIAPSVTESVRFDIACIRAIGYAPERLRFTLSNADGHTVKAYQAIIPE